MIDHGDVREQLEIAAVEPGGLDRVMAGDTPDAIALASHLAGCSSCLEELGRLRATSGILRDVIASEPPAELRDRTLAFVRDFGVPRGPRLGTPPLLNPVRFTPDSGDAASGVAAPTGSDDAEGRTEPIEIGDRRRSIATRGRLLWAASIAAAIVLSIAGTTAYFGSRSDDDGLALAKVASWSVELAGETDTRHVALVSNGGLAAARGELAYSPTSSDMVVVARGLPAAPSGSEYRCWLQSATGERTKIGKMSLSYGIYFWVGDVPNLANLAPGTRFGVSLEGIDGSGGGAPSLVGQL